VDNQAINTGAVMKSSKQNIDNAIKKAGIQAEIFKGNGYFYFVGKSIDLSQQQGVYGVSRFSDLSLDRWVEECKELVKQ
jgi:hypothetical protein